jgi:uncharacterized membrane protein YeiH
VGGGTLRDLLIGVPVFWVGKPVYLPACLVPALAVWVFGYGQWRERALFWRDALGMALALQSAALIWGGPCRAFRRG